MSNTFKESTSCIVKTLHGPAANRWLLGSIVQGGEKRGGEKGGTRGGVDFSHVV